MITCAFCGASLEPDSWYCDQCGEELKVCPTCGKAGKHKRCPDHGAALVPAKDRAAAPAPAGPASSPGAFAAAAPPRPPIVGGAAAEPAAAPEAPRPPGGALRLINHTLGLDLAVSDGCLIGRAAGELVHVFSRYPATSSRHCQLQRTAGGGWTVTDLGSSNGTFVNDGRLPPNQPAALVHGCYLRVANLEFLVSLPAAAAATPTGTVRL